MVCCIDGSASRITRYWLDWVKMVETMRWPKLSYSALSTVAGVMPKRAAVARSMVICAASPLCCMSLATSVICGTCCSRVHQLGHPRGEVGGVRILQHELVLRGADRGVDRQILHRLHEQGDAGHVARLVLQAADDRAGASGCGRRAACRLMRKRPAFSVVLLPSTPMNEDRLTTSGSFRIAAASRSLPPRHRAERDGLRAPARCPGSRRCPAPGRSPWG